ncbi:MAG: hypothetical protein R3F48_01030 [Candidatus Zixiibacteriota bacterium]
MTTSRALIRTILFCLFIGSLVLAGSETKTDFSLKTLDGNWSGEGEVIVPMMGFPISIEGKASFAYDTLQNYLRTSIQGEKFYFSYEDSGHLYHDTATDSIRWEIWDGFGEYGIYYGHIEDGMLKGTLEKEKWLFHIKVDFINTDSMTFTMTAQKGYVGEEKPQATIDLWRVK